MSSKTTRITDVIRQGLVSLQLTSGTVITGTIDEIATNDNGTIEALVITGAQFQASDLGPVWNAQLVVPYVAVAFINTPT